MNSGRVLPVPAVKLGVGRGGYFAPDAQQRAEGVERVEAPIEAERELVEVGPDDERRAEVARLLSSAGGVVADAMRRLIEQLNGMDVDEMHAKLQAAIDELCECIADKLNQPPEGEGEG